MNGERWPLLHLPEIMERTAINIGRGLRLITLSRFAGDRANALRQQRIHDYELRCAEHQSRLVEYIGVRDVARLRAKQALRNFRLLDAWRSWHESRRAEKVLEQLRRMAPVVRAASIEEQQARVGDEAERRLDDCLAVALDAKWTLIAGYSGRGGEIDRILIGPWGIYAFEVKGNRGVIHSDGSRWWVARFGRHGKPLGIKVIPRAPDAQLAASTKWLAKWFARNGIWEPIVRVVLFTADDARLGIIRSTDADLVATLRSLDLGNLFDPGSKRSSLAPQLCERIANLVVRDHLFWWRRRLGAPETANRRSEGEVTQAFLPSL